MYSLHMRKNIIDIKRNEKLSVREAARRFGISPNTVYKWGKKIEPKGWRKQRVSKIDMKKLEEDVNEWGDYVQFLSNGRTKSLDFVESVVGDIARSKKANEYNLTKSFTRAKYMKNKLQSFEVAYVMDSSPLKKEIKNNKAFKRSLLSRVPPALNSSCTISI